MRDESASIAMIAGVNGDRNKVRQMIYIYGRVRDIRNGSVMFLRRLKVTIFLIDIVQSGAFNKPIVQRPFIKNVDPFALLAVYSDARILAGRMLDRLGDK
jgi:hypothetical protein